MYSWSSENFKSSEKPPDRDGSGQLQVVQHLYKMFLAQQWLTGPRAGEELGSCRANSEHGSEAKNLSLSASTLCGNIRYGSMWGVLPSKQRPRKSRKNCRSRLRWPADRTDTAWHPRQFAAFCESVFEYCLIPQSDNIAETVSVKTPFPNVFRNSLWMRCMVYAVYAGARLFEIAADAVFNTCLASRW